MTSHSSRATSELCLLQLESVWPHSFGSVGCTGRLRFLTQAVAVVRCGLPGSADMHLNVHAQEGPVYHGMRQVHGGAL